jgi:hypothetical protein
VALVVALGVREEEGMVVLQEVEEVGGEGGAWPMQLGRRRHLRWDWWWRWRLHCSGPFCREEESRRAAMGLEMLHQGRVLQGL